MNEALQNLKDRGFLSQCTDIDALSKKMDEGAVTFYEGCDRSNIYARRGTAALLLLEAELRVSETPAVRAKCAK